jgi:hypothetical protein
VSKSFRAAATKSSLWYRLGHAQGGRDGRPAALSLRVPLGQLRELFDPAGTAGGECHDGPKRQLLEVLDGELWYFHGDLVGLVCQCWLMAQTKV